MSILFDGFTPGEIRQFPGMKQTYMAAWALKWTQARRLAWRFKTWENGGNAFVMRIDGLSDEEIARRIDESPCPAPARGAGSKNDMLIVNKANLSKGVKPGKFTIESRYKWHEMNVRDFRVVCMIRRDIHYFLSRFLLNHPDFNDWEFTCKRQRELEDPENGRQVWTITRTK